MHRLQTQMSFVFFRGGSEEGPLKRPSATDKVFFGTPFFELFVIFAEILVLIHPDIMQCPGILRHDLSFCPGGAPALIFKVMFKFSREAQI